MPDLKDIIKNTDSKDLRGQLESITKNIKEQEDDKLNAFLDTLQGIVESNKETSKALTRATDILEKILNRPNPEFPEQKEVQFPKVQEVSMKRPNWYKEPEKLEIDFKLLAKELAPHFSSLEEKIGNEHDMTRDAIYNTETQIPESVEKKKGVQPMNIGSIRRHSRWQMASTSKGNITSAGDGLTFYLPFAPIPLSETVRLNGGLPLSNGEDYTMTGNKIVFVQDQTGSKIEVRAQN